MFFNLSQSFTLRKELANITNLFQKNILYFLKSLTLNLSGNNLGENVEYLNSLLKLF